MKNWITDHPYFCSSIVFLIIMVIGWQVLYWPAENFMFLLLLYFIVTLGIRLDDISRKIGSGGDRPEAGFKQKENVISQLHDIKNTLLRLNTTLNKLVEKTEKEDN
jgi:hypothetical protein